MLLHDVLTQLSGTRQLRLLQCLIIPTPECRLMSLPSLYMYAMPLQKRLAMPAAQTLRPALIHINHLIVFDVVISPGHLRCLLKPYLLTQTAESVTDASTHTR